MPHSDRLPHARNETSTPDQTRSEAVTAAHRTHYGLHRLPPPAAELVLHGDLTGRYATGSYSRLSREGSGVTPLGGRRSVAEHGHRITAAIACHVARAGGTLDQLGRLLLHPDHEGGRHLRTIQQRSGHARAQDYLHRLWTNASALVGGTTETESRHHAHEDLAALRERIETTPWPGERGRTALRVLRAHLTFAESAGGRLHAASERQTAENAGISRQTLRSAYESVLKPGGWLRRLRAGRGREGSTWYLGDGPATAATTSPASRHRTSQFPPARTLDEWHSPETTPSADIDSRVIGHLMAHDAFASRALGSSALMVIGALRARPGQTANDLVATASISRATAYRTLQRLAHHGLAHRTGQGWDLVPGALADAGNSLPDAVTEAAPAQERHWDEIAQRYGTAGIAAQRKARHAVERAAYREALDAASEHRTKTPVVLQDGQLVPVPAPRGDEVPPHLRTPGGDVLDPATGRVVPEWRVATDGRLILTSPADQCPYDDLVAAHTRAVTAWESAA